MRIRLLGDPISDDHVELTSEFPEPTERDIDSIRTEAILYLSATTERLFAALARGFPLDVFVRGNEAAARELNKLVRKINKAERSAIEFLKSDQFASIVRQELTEELRRAFLEYHANSEHEARLPAFAELARNAQWDAQTIVLNAIPDKDSAVLRQVSAVRIGENEGQWCLMADDIDQPLRINRVDEKWFRHFVESIQSKLGTEPPRTVFFPVLEIDAGKPWKDGQKLKAASPALRKVIQRFNALIKNWATHIGGGAWIESVSRQGYRLSHFVRWTFDPELILGGRDKQARGVRQVSVDSRTIEQNTPSSEHKLPARRRGGPKPDSANDVNS